MKKMICALTAGIAILTSSLSVYASTLNPNPGYFSSQHPQTNAAISESKTKRFPATDITITNASANTIYVIVPNTPINDTLYPGSNPDHIRNSNGAFYTTIVLQNYNRMTFFNETVCPRALITVYDNRVNVDNEYCN